MTAEAGWVAHGHMNHDVMGPYLHGLLCQLEQLIVRPSEGQRREQIDVQVHQLEPHQHMGDRVRPSTMVGP